MWLLNAKSKQLEYFPYQNLVKYAILSHTWEDGEVTFTDFRSGSIDKKPGYYKIQRALDQTVQDGLDYVWVDTCCIDKSSSAELMEAINSMFQWYANAFICYAYLPDVPFGIPVTAKDSPFSAARWFTRGWTLQELIAPTRVIFFGTGWQHLGSRNIFAQTISDITNIPVDILRGRGHLSDYSIAKRMSWASKRKTTRIEDEAYCLLGIFNINMPMIYGEGSKAFIRLQLEIMKEQNDHSMFAWEGSIEEYPRGLLARSPAEFALSSDYIAYDSTWLGSFAATNRGIRLETAIFRKNEENIAFYAVLNCHPNNPFARSLTSEQLSIPLIEVEEGIYARSGPVERVSNTISELRAHRKSVILVKDHICTMNLSLKPWEIFTIPSGHVEVDASWPHDSWDQKRRCVVGLNKPDKPWFVVLSCRVWVMSNSPQFVPFIMVLGYSGHRVDQQLYRAEVQMYLHATMSKSQLETQVLVLGKKLEYVRSEARKMIISSHVMNVSLIEDVVMGQTIFKIRVHAFPASVRDIWTCRLNNFINSPAVRVILFTISICVLVYL